MTSEISTFEAYSTDGCRLTERDVRGRVVYKGRMFKPDGGGEFRVLDIKPEDESPVVTICIKLSS